MSGLYKVKQQMNITKASARTAQVVQNVHGCDNAESALANHASAWLGHAKGSFRRLGKYFQPSFRRLLPLKAAMMAVLRMRPWVC